MKGIGRLRLLAPLLVAAHLIAWYGLRPLGVSYWFAVPVLAALLLLAAEIAMPRSSKDRKDPFARVHRLTNAEARVQARELLRDAAKFTVAQEPCRGAEDFTQLSETVAELFREYSSIRSVAGELHLSRQLIAPAELKEGFVRIGTDIEHTELAVLPGADEIYELDELSRGEDPSPTYRTIFHLIVATDEQLYRE